MGRPNARLHDCKQRRRWLRVHPNSKGEERMTTFTELLDEYLESKAEVVELRKYYEGFCFEYAYFKEHERLSEARAALNIAFIEASAGKPSQTGSLL
jgi:predicted AlkP superfamily phosphohydrolase/phosphomutase